MCVGLLQPITARDELRCRFVISLGNMAHEHIEQWDVVLQVELGEDMAAYRLAAYRHLVLWLNGHLGQGNRVPLPSCAVCKIRSRYPDPNGRYTGFKPTRLGIAE